jgi:hypothetical protein
MSKLPAWKKKLLAAAHGLGPFGVQDWLESKFRREIPLSSFRCDIKTQLPGIRDALSDKTTTYLYERCIWAQVLMMKVRFAQRMVTKKRWRQGRRYTQELLQLLKKYPSYDLMQTMGTTFRRRKQPKAPDEVKALVGHLEDLQEQGTAWEKASRTYPSQDQYRACIFAMEKHLRKHYAYNKTQIGNIVSVAAATIGLKKKVSLESVMKLLSPKRRRGRKRLSSLV